MKTSSLALLIVLAAFTGAGAQAPAPGAVASVDPITAVLRQVQQGLATGNARYYLSLLTRDANRSKAIEFCGDELQQGATRAVLEERSRTMLTPDLARVLVDVFVEYGDRGHGASWRLDLDRQGGTDGVMRWRIADEEVLTRVDSVYRLSLDPSREYDVRGLTIAAEDFELTLDDGSVFVADTDQGVTAVVLTGRGQMHFHPAPAVEKQQVKIFAGTETIDTPFSGAFIRMNPSDFDDRVAPLLPAAHAADPVVLKRAAGIFQAEALKSFNLDLGDLSPEPWWYLPPPGDFLAEVRTRRFDTLTYSHASSEDEDISLFDRVHQKNISLYASKAKLARRGRFYDEDDRADYDILSYNLDVAINPDRQWLDGVANITIQVKAPSISRVVFKLADALAVRSVVSDNFGPLMAVRIRGQNSLVATLPAVVVQGTDLRFTVAYSGRLKPQDPDTEAALPQQPPGQGFQVPEEIPMERVLQQNWLYTERSYWYPQAQTTKYATANIRIELPPAYSCVATGEPYPSSGAIERNGAGDEVRVFSFAAAEPVRYLAVSISRFSHVDPVVVKLPETAAATDDPPADVTNDQLRIDAYTPPRQTSRGREIEASAADVARFYASILHDFPYPTYTVAMVENDRPGGHSPAYMTSLSQPAPGQPWPWRSDPTVFSAYPEFFVAHELAHQWWGDAVGWQNYHEQWLSEGFSQYFAALYAEYHEGEDTFGDILHQMRDWAMDKSDQGPVYLGYRLGHVKQDGRIFRAIVYDKGAVVLHMLRRLMGDEAFFRGIRHFYETSKFQKVGTDDFRRAMEAETTLPLSRFFERWIYGSTLPTLTYSSQVAGSDLVLRVDQAGAEIFDVPVTFTLEFADHSKQNVVVRMTGPSAELHVPLTKRLRKVEFDEDDGTLAEVHKK
jgi:Peptidase family M1 domain